MTTQTISITQKAKDLLAAKAGKVETPPPAATLQTPEQKAAQKAAAKLAKESAAKPAKEAKKEEEKESTVSKATEAMKIAIAEATKTVPALPKNCKCLPMVNVESMIGQSRAKEQAAGLFMHLANRTGEPIKPRLIGGPSGTGKSRLVGLILKDLAAAGFATVHVRDAGALSLQSGSETANVVGAFNASRFGKIAVVLDECQKLFNGEGEAMKRDILQFILPHGENVQSEITGKIVGESVTANFRNLVLFNVTNEITALESAASRRQGEAPFARRHSVIEVGNYSQSEMEMIIPSVFAAAGYEIADCAVGLVNRLHRGNMEALCEVLERVKERVHKAEVTKKELIASAKLTQWLPRGLSKGEARLLDALTRNDLPKALAAQVSQRHGKLLDASIAHLQNQFSVNGTGERIHTPLLALVGAGKLSIAKAGATYLEAIKKEGFEF